MVTVEIKMVAESAQAVCDHLGMIVDMIDGSAELNAAGYTTSDIHGSSMVEVSKLDDDKSDDPLPVRSELAGSPARCMCSDCGRVLPHRVAKQNPLKQVQPIDGEEVEEVGLWLEVWPCPNCTQNDKMRRGEQKLN